MNKLPSTLPCDTCNKPTSLDMAGEVRIPDHNERALGYELVVICVECQRKDDEDN